MATTNPLDSFASKATPGTIKLPSFPNLGQLVSEAGFKAGHEKHHELMQEWIQRVEQLLNERFQSKDNVPTGKVQ